MALQTVPVVMDWVKAPLSALAVKVLDWAGFVSGLLIVITGRVGVVKLSSLPLVVPAELVALARR